MAGCTTWLASFFLASRFRIDILTVVHEFRSFIAELGFFEKHVIIESVIVIVIKVHNTAHEGVLNVLWLILISIVIDLERDHHRLHNEVCCVDHGVCVQLSEILNLLYAFLFELTWSHSLVVGVTWALLNSMSLLFTANTAQLLGLFLMAALLFLLIKVIFAFMLGKLAPRRIDAPLSTTPPHLTAPLRLMHAARPIIILLFIELLGAILTGFLRFGEITFLRDQLLYSDA